MFPSCFSLTKFLFTLKTLDFTIHIGSTPTFLYFDLQLLDSDYEIAHEKKNYEIAHETRSLKNAYSHCNKTKFEAWEEENKRYESVVLY